MAACSLVYDEMAPKLSPIAALAMDAREPRSLSCIMTPRCPSCQFLNRLSCTYTETVLEPRRRLCNCAAIGAHAGIVWMAAA
jgi:hypothetical protein